MTDPHDTPMSPRTEILHVRVVEQSCRMSTAGTKTFRTIKHFVIRVRDDFGNERPSLLVTVTYSREPYTLLCLTKYTPSHPLAPSLSAIRSLYHSLFSKKL
ncbi:MAG: hypothetical protein IKC97_03665, partial [Clostridia bacterium]|nr:hypothetical protein [Clostridia bacterium]